MTRKLCLTVCLLFCVALCAAASPPDYDALNENHQAFLKEQRVLGYQTWAVAQLEFAKAWTYDDTLAWVGGQLKSFKASANDIDWPLLAVSPRSRDVIQEKLGIDLSETTGARLTADQQHAIYAAAHTYWPGWKHDIDKELAAQAARDVATAALLPIDVDLLRPAVWNLYHETFQQYWGKFDANDRMYLAKKTGEVPTLKLLAVAPVAIVP